MHNLRTGSGHASILPALATALLALAVAGGCASRGAEQDDYARTINIFQGAGESGQFFDSAYGYAVFPTVGKAGFVVGGAYGNGRVYERGLHVGNSKVVQLSVGFQAGGQAFSQIIFFQDKRAFDEFTSGNFEFGAQVSAVAITAAASAAATTAGPTAGASGGRHDATTAGGYYKGMATFVVATGGLMWEASIGGQKFSYAPLSGPPAMPAETPPAVEAG